MCLSNCLNYKPLGIVYDLKLRKLSNLILDTDLYFCIGSDPIVNLYLFIGRCVA